MIINSQRNRLNVIDLSKVFVPGRAIPAANTAERRRLRLTVRTSDKNSCWRGVRRQWSVPWAKHCEESASRMTGVANNFSEG
jgi:hypothetical protein